MRFTKEHADQANLLIPNTLAAHLDIRFHVDAEGRLCATMPVDPRTHQPFGLLHGGATAALAETLGSTASFLVVQHDGKAVVGVELSASHVKGVRSGSVTATGELVHQGRTTHVWDIRVHNGSGELCAIFRMTNLEMERRRVNGA